METGALKVGIEQETKVEPRLILKVGTVAPKLFHNTSVVQSFVSCFIKWM